MPIVKIHIYRGKDILTIIIDPDLDNWGVRGIPASEVDLGVNLNV